MCCVFSRKKNNQNDSLSLASSDGNFGANQRIGFRELPSNLRKTKLIDFKPKLSNSLIYDYSTRSYLLDSKYGLFHQMFNNITIQGTITVINEFKWENNFSLRS